MKYKIIITVMAILVVSCQPEKAGLDKLKADRFALATQYDEIGKQIATLDAEIAKYDSTQRHALVTTIPVAQKSFQHFFEVQGTIEADKNVTLYPEMGGIVRSINVSEGQRVRKGDILIDLDTELIELQIKELQSNLELATTTYERQKRLWDQKIGSEMQYLQAKNQKESIENSIATLKAQLRKNSVIAPFDGVIDEIWPRIGELTSPQTPTVRLVNLDHVYIKADVSESYIGAIKKGTEVEVFFPAFNHSVTAKVSVIGNFINPNNRTFKINVDIPNKENNIKPNLMAYVRVKDYEQKNALVIPQRLIQESPNGDNFVYIVLNHQTTTKAKKVQVKVGPSYKNETQILSGLPDSAILVDKGSRSIKDGQTVQITQL